MDRAAARELLGPTLFDRQCTIEIKNECSSHTLMNPRIYLHSGQCSKPLPYMLGPSKETTALFIKTKFVPRGVVGVFTYDLAHTDKTASVKKIAVMFSVPFDFNLYTNCYAAGFFETDQTCDHDLYKEMYNNSAGEDFVKQKANDPIHVACAHFRIMATMSDTYEPYMKVEIHDK